MQTAAGITNSDLFRQIAEDALAIAVAELAMRKLPIDGEAGRSILVHDPQRTGFKQSLIAIVFAGMYIEARLFIVGSHRVGIDEYRLIDRKVIEERLIALGIADTSLIADCKAYREARRELVHEKATDPQFYETIRMAQDVATRSVALMDRVDRALA